MKQIRYLKKWSSLWTFFHYNRFADDIEWVHLPAELNAEWIEMPVQFTDNLSNDEIFGKLNLSNPLSSEKNQAWIREHDAGHTSMSIGDVVQDSDGTWHVCLREGWAKIAWISKEHGHLVSFSSSSTTASCRCECGHNLMRHNRFMGEGKPFGCVDCECDGFNSIKGGSDE
jgi:hypothetical protein